MVKILLSLALLVLLAFPQDVEGQLEAILNLGGSSDNAQTCKINSECNNQQACVNQICVNACAGACGTNAKCEVVNHAPQCTCPADFNGNPFVNCIPA